MGQRARIPTAVVVRFAVCRVAKVRATIPSTVRPCSKVEPSGGREGTVRKVAVFVSIRTMFIIVQDVYDIIIRRIDYRLFDFDRKYELSTYGVYVFFLPRIL